MTKKNLYIYLSLFILHFSVLAQPQELTLHVNTDIVVPQEAEIKELENFTYPRLLRIGVPGSSRPPIYNKLEAGKFG